MRTHLLVGTKKGAWIYTSDAKRACWSLSEPQMPGWTINHMAADLRRDPPRLYAAANHFAWGPSVARSDDMGKTWEQRSPGLGFPQDMGITVEAVWHVEPGPASQPGVVYAGVQPGGLFRSDDWGESWAPVESLNRIKYRQFWGPAGLAGNPLLHSIQFDPRDDRRLYAAVSTGGTYVSEDGGESWNLCSHGLVVTTPQAREILAQLMESFPQPELPDGVDPASLDEFHKFRIDVKNPDRLWGMAHFGVFKSECRGQKWEDVTAGLPGFHGFPLAVTKRHPDAVFVMPLDWGKDNFRVMPGQFAIYRTGDGARTWEKLTRGLPECHDYQSALREGMDTDGLDPEGVYVGTNNGQVYAGADLGDCWQRLPGTLPPVTSVTAASW